MKKFIGILTLITIISISSTPHALQAQAPLKFPSKLKFTSQSGGLSYNAALFYTQNTQIKRFGRELSSLRWTIQLKEDNDFRYMEESYIFNDDFSLYRDAVVSAEIGVTSQVTLKETDQTGSIKRRTIARQTAHQSLGTIQTRIVDSYMDISKISSILVAAREVSANTSKFKEIFHYFSPDANEEIVRMIYMGEKWETVKGIRIPTKVVTLTRNNEEIHSLQFYRDSHGYYFPVVIHFDVNNAQRSLKMKLDQLPEPLPASEPNRIVVVYLEFINTGTWTLKPQTPADNLVHRTVYNEIRDLLNKTILSSDKQLILDLKTAVELNTPTKIKQLIDITFEQDVTSKAKIEKMVDLLNIPEKVDIVVTGQYTDIPQNSNIMIRPIIIFKNEARISTRNLMFQKAQMLRLESVTNKYVPCPNSQNYIIGEIEKFISANVVFNNVTDGLTIENAYRMIIENRLPCHSTDYGRHYEILDRLKESDKIDQLDSIVITNGKEGNNSYFFTSDWDIRAQIEQGKEIVKTVSINKKDYKKTFTLYWDVAEGRTLTYEKALQKIDQLNAQKNQGHSDWRLPTLKEVLIIAQYNNKTGGFFPFKLPPKIDIWTSTPLEESEKRHLTFSSHEAYFVVKSFIDGQTPKLQFDFTDKENEALFLPIRSATRPLGELDNSGNKELIIANLAFMKTEQRSPIVSETIGQSINNAVNIGMNMAAAFNNRLAIKDNKQIPFNSIDTANLMTNIFFDPNLTREEKINRIIGNIMNPHRIDLLVTGFLIDNSSHDAITIRPMVIYKYKQDIQAENLQFNRNEFECSPHGRQGELCPPTADQITKAVKELLEQS